MTENLGHIVARLEATADTISPDVIELINRNVKPPQPVTAEQVYVRAMYVVSDQINSFGGRFPVDEHERLAHLLIDTPVMIGHRKDRLPVGRTFHAATIERDDCRWVKSWFYWLRDAEQADDLLANIDGGICKECSIAFTFSFPECSLCGKDIRLCDHEPHREYDNGRVCHFNYRHIERVLETSLVYRGANPDTSITKDLHTFDTPFLTPLRSLDELDPADTYVIVPRYDSIPVTACLSDKALRVFRPDGTHLKDFPLAGASVPTVDPAAIVTGQLVGYRGRVRCTSADLAAILSDKQAQVTRMVLNLMPGQSWRLSSPWAIGPDISVREIPHRIGRRSLVSHLARQIMTRDGVAIHPRGPAGVGLLGYLYHPDLPGTQRRNAYVILGRADDDTALLCLGDSPAAVFEIRNWDLALLRAGRRFVAHLRPAALAHSKAMQAIGEGQIVSRKVAQSARMYGVNGALNGTLVCRPIRISGCDAFSVHLTSREEKQS
jgi:hypothetical protein